MASVNSPSTRLFGSPLTDKDGRLTTSWIQWLQLFYSQVCAMLGVYNSGVSGTVTLAKLTGGGANGSLTVKNGIITAIVEPT